MIKNQCDKCDNKASQEGRHCSLFIKEPEGCIVFSPIRGVRPDKLMHIGKLSILKDIIALAIGVYKIKSEKKEDPK